MFIETDSAYRLQVVVYPAYPWTLLVNTIRKARSSSKNASMINNKILVLPNIFSNPYFLLHTEMIVSVYTYLVATNYSNGVGSQVLGTFMR